MDLLTAEHGGLVCRQGHFTIDPVIPAETAVITHAHGDHARPGSATYHCSREGAPYTRARVTMPDSPPPRIVAHDWGERFDLGGVTVSFHPAGHIRGAAQIRLEHGGEVWVASGDYKRDADPTTRPFEVVPCDVFVTEATFALPIYRWPAFDAVIEDIFAWWQQNRDAGRCTMLFCYALGKAQRLLAGLSRLTDGPIHLHGALIPMTDAYRADGVTLPETRNATDDSRKDGFAGELVLAPPSASRSTWMKRFDRAETGFASGWMRVRGVRRGRGWDRGFVVSDHVDWPGIIRTVRQTGARRVLATHGRTDILVRYLGEHGIAAAPLATAYGDEDD